MIRANAVATAYQLVASVGLVATAKLLASRGAVRGTRAFFRWMVSKAGPEGRLYWQGAGIDVDRLLRTQPSEGFAEPFLSRPPLDQASSELEPGGIPRIHRG
jgi:hypothetical protein